MTERLVATSRDTLAEAIDTYARKVAPSDASATGVARHLIDSGVVRVIDPDAPDPELVERVAGGLFLEANPGCESAWNAPGVMGKGAWYPRARAAIEAVLR